MHPLLLGHHETICLHNLCNDARQWATIYRLAQGEKEIARLGYSHPIYRIRVTLLFPALKTAISTDYSLYRYLVHNALFND